MNTLPNLDFTVSPIALSVDRSPASKSAPNGADFSEKFKESLNAISRDEGPPKTESRKPDDSPRVTRAEQDQPEDEPEDDLDGRPEGATDAGQNLPVVLAMVPANITSVPQLESQVEAPPQAGTQTVLSVDSATFSGPVAMPVTGLAEEGAHSPLPQGAQALAPVQADASNGSLVFNPVATAFTAPDAGALAALTGAAERELSPQAASQSLSGAASKLNEGPLSSAQMTTVEAKLLESVTARRADTPLVMATSGAKTVSVDSIGSANQALLQARHADQLLAAAPKPVGADPAPSFTAGALEPESSLPTGLGLAVDDAPSGVMLATPVSPQGVGMAKPISAAEPMPQSDAEFSPLALEQGQGLAALDQLDSGAKPPGESMFPGIGAGLAIAGQVGVSSPVAQTSPSPAQAPAMAVPAAQLNGEIVKFASVGGGRAVMEITSPDLGALKIDLSIDARGVARMVVEASTGAARDQLEQGLRQLHDDFAGIGLSLDVDVRQGGSGAYQRDLPAQYGSRATVSAGASAAEGPGVTTSRTRIAGAEDDKTLVHFYA